MIGMRVRFEDPLHLQLQLANASQHLLRRDGGHHAGAAIEVQHRIDQNPLTRARVVNEIRVGAGQRVIEGLDCRNLRDAHALIEYMKTATLISAADAPQTAERVRRLRSLAWLLDNSIPLPGGYRIGVDPIIGLVPGLGDAIGALFSAFIINEARSLGAPRSILLRMIGNVVLETVIGAIPFAGDIFDAAFKANSRNLALLARYQLDPIGSRRSSRFLVFGFSLLLALVVAFVVAVPVLVIVALFKLF